MNITRISANPEGRRQANLPTPRCKHYSSISANPGGRRQAELPTPRCTSCTPQHTLYRSVFSDYGHGTAYSICSCYLSITFGTHNTFIWHHHISAECVSMVHHEPVVNQRLATMHVSSARSLTSFVGYYIVC